VAVTPARSPPAADGDGSSRRHLDCRVEGVHRVHPARQDHRSWRWRTPARRSRTDGDLGSATVRAALESKDIDLYWDYTGTGWVNILGNSPTDLPEDLYEAVSKAEAENGIAWLEPAPFENAYAIATSSDFAERTTSRTMSDASSTSSRTRTTA
jgi:hypothetical protein